MGMLARQFLFTLFLLFVTGKIRAQDPAAKTYSFYHDKVRKAPESVFTLFKEAGMQPTNHELTFAEQEKVDSAFSILPPLYQRILRQNLESISFMDNMPNTALTSTLETTDTSKRFNITFRAGILHETISEWATWKEKSAFDFTGDPTRQLFIEAGTLSAIVYVLLHEATHVVDGVLKLTPQAENRDSLVPPTAFTKKIWHLFNIPVAKYRNPFLENTRFKTGKVLPIGQAPALYNSLEKTPFPSLYALASWNEDLAELITIYHLTQKLNQPFVILVMENGKVLKRFEPAKNKRVMRRFKRLAYFYK